ncbi:hypothetical protein [Streptococcus sp. 20-1249]|uniref:hypothetical protein n=1 Tax=Streptococcus hepaticus TaxID=3349163 RepID=UPI00374A7C7F
MKFLKEFTISGLDLEVQGDWWDVNFALVKNGTTLATISQEWMTLTSTLSSYRLSR